jgi:RHS repeat-associated protein
MNRVVTRTDPLLRAQSYAFDAAGNLTKFTDRRGKVATFTYDNLNRRTFAGFGTVVGSRSTTYESTINYTFDAGHRVTKTVDSAYGTSTFTYDGLDRLLSKATPQGSIGYTYDAASRPATMTVAGQPAVNYAFDADGRLTGITKGGASVALTYDDADRRTSMTLPNGLTVEYAYDSKSNLAGLTYKNGGTVLGDITYERDSLGNRTKVGGSFASLAAAQPAAMTYDAGNQLKQKGSAALTYDANGNLTADGVNTYTWDARNQLTSVSGSVNASFGYDAVGRRTKKTVNGSTTEYLHDGLNTVQELSGGAVTANLLTGTLDEVFTRATSAGAQTPLVDGLGSTLALTDASGSIQTQYAYDAFGNTTTTGAASNYPFQYAGRENDGTGLYYNRARYYAPGLQRFVSQDPVGFFGGVNHYAYVGNNPVNLIDPMGLDGGNPFLDGLQLALDVAGMVPGFGEPFDLVNAGISGLRGDYSGAALSMAAVVPFAGNVAGAAKIGDRVRDIHNALDPIAQSRRTTAIVEAVDSSGNVTRIVASSENSLSAAQRAALRPGEVAATGPGHAEVTALNAAQQMGLTPVNVGASRPICPSCAGAIQNAGATPVTPLK